MSDLLISAVRRFSSITATLPPPVLDSPIWADGGYDGVRYALLHTTLELRQAAARLLRTRTLTGCAPTLAHHALAQHQAAFRDLEAVLLAVDDATYRSAPTGEWSLQTVVAHVHSVERFFVSAILNTLAGGEPRMLTKEEHAILTDEPVVIAEDADQATMWADYTRLHQKVQQHLRDLADDRMTLACAAWEPEPWPTIEFRLHRFDAHLREHTNQAEKVLRALDQQPGEAKLLLRQLYAALAEVEGAAIGAETLAAETLAALAARIDAWCASLAAALAIIAETEALIAANEVAGVQALLARTPEAAYTLMEDGTSAILYSQYRGRRALVDVLLASGMRLEINEAAAVGDTDRVRKILDAWPEEVNYFARDGYTPLELACFFGYADCAALLLERGADVHAVARNATRVRPIHAAVAGNHAAIVAMLIAHGADVNARQQDDFTPLMAARQNGNAEIEGMLVAAGAV